MTLGDTCITLGGTAEEVKVYLVSESEGFMNPHERDDVTDRGSHFRLVSISAFLV